MKRLMFLILALLIIGVSYIYSVEVSCRNECYDEIPYTTREMFFTMPGCPSCTVRVVFLTREGVCDGERVRDIYLEQITGTRECCACWQFQSISTVLREALRHVLTRYYWSIDGLPPGAMGDIKVKYPPCMWAPGKTTKAFCLNGECCIHRYKILAGEPPSDTNILIEHKVIQGYDGECPVYENRQCENICSVYVPILGNPIILEADERNVNEVADFQVISNPADEKVEVRLSKSIEAFSLEIYNFIGTLVYEQNPVAGSGHISIPLSNYPSGLYYLVLKTLSGRILKKYLIINH